MKPKKLSYKKFLESFKYAPRPAVNLLIEQTIEGSHPSMEGCEPSKAILLTKRRKPPFAGSWHLPGSWVMKHEPLADCIERVAREELGVKVENIELAGNFDDLDADPRGHAIDLVYRCTIKVDQKTSKRPGLFQKGQAFPMPVGDSAEIRFFQKLPKNIGFNHRDTLKKLGYK